MGQPSAGDLERSADRSRLTAMAARTKSDGRPGRSLRTAHDSTAVVSFASTPGVRRKMQSQPSRDTAPEMALRRAVHAMGLRYRVDRAPIPGLRRRADLVFGPIKLAIYVDGCFWHACPEHGNWPRTNSGWWQAKLQRNQARDRETDLLLATAGWTTLRIWEHEPPSEAAQRVADAIRRLRRPSVDLDTT